MVDSSSSSANKDAWTRKRKLTAKAAAMREAKRRIREAGTSSSVAIETPTMESAITPPEEETGPAATDEETLQDVEMDQDHLISDNSDGESDDEGGEFAGMYENQIW